MSAKTQRSLRVLRKARWSVWDPPAPSRGVRVIPHEENLEARSRRERSGRLYFRLRGIRLLPPLRDRPEDIPALVRHFAELFSRDNNRRPQRFTPAALEHMQKARWKGNVRELKNTVERLIIMTPGDAIDVDDLRDIVRLEAEAGPGDNEKERPGTLREFKE